MSVIIRLQNLPWSANAADIRQYFQGLSIPEGGVHIVGGEKGDAFISFSTDEDARQAMLSDGGCIKDVQIRLLLSSRNEMQKVIETARQQTIQITQVYMHQMQQPQLPLVGSLPPLTAKVLPQPQQQSRPNQLVTMLQRQLPIMDPTAVLMSQDKQQQLQQQSQPHMSPKSMETKDRDDKSGYKRERIRSKSREHRSRSSRSSGSNRRDRSRSRDRRRRDRSRGRDRSRDRYRNGGGNRNSSSRGSGGKPHTSRSPVSKAVDIGKGILDQQPSNRTWNGQYENIQPQAMTDNHQPPVMNVGPPGNVGINHFRTPPQPPIVPGLAANTYQQQPQQPANNEWGNDESLPPQQQPFVPNNNFRGEAYGGGSDDEDDRQAEFDNNYHRRFNDNNNPAMRRGRPGQDFNDQQGFGANRNLRFHKPQQSMGGGQQNRGGHRQFDSFGGGGGPRFNHHQQNPRYGGGPDGNGGGGGGRPSRFSSIQQDGNGGKPPRFNSMPQQRGRDNAGGDGSDFNNDPKRAAAPARFNDRYRYDVRNAQTTRAEGLCVEVNNMTNHFSYGDVRKVFEGIHIDGSAIKIQKHRQGVAFVRFDNNHNKNLALRMNGNAYKGNNVVVKHLDDEAYERENTDDRPYPTTVAATAVATATTAAASATTTTTAIATPGVVDLVDLVDDEEDNDGGQSSAKKRKNDERNNEDSNNPVTCDKNPSAAEGEGQQSTATLQQQPQQKQQQDAPTKYLKLKQLPITVTEEDVLNEMDGGGEVRRVTFYPDGEFMGAALEFRSVDEAEATLKRFDCVLLGSTPVPVLRCTYKEYVQIKRKSGGGTKRFSGENTSGGGGSGGRHYNHQHHNPVPVPAQSNVAPTGSRSNCVYVHGLPTSVTNTDITQFFADTSVLPDKIHIMLSKFGRPTGESYCEFSTVQQAHTALIKDQCYMGPNLVHVSPINRSDMIQAITKPMQQHNHHQDMSWGPGGGSGNRGGGGGGPRQHNMMSGPPRQQHQGPQYGGGGHNGGYGGGRPQPYMNNARGGGGGGGYTPRMRGPGPNSGPDGFGQPGCVVALDNVPYCADVQEIVDFFSGFELNSQNVIRRFNDFGKPTGEARVNLRNPQEAMRAVRVLQNKPIFNRPVHLTLL